MAFDEEFGYEECVSNTRWVMKIVGLWPLEDAVIIPTCKVLLLLILLVFTLIIPQTRKAIQVHDDLNLMLEVLTIADINLNIALLKTLTMCYYKIDLRKLLVCIYKDWQNVTVEEQRKMRTNARMSKLILTFIISICIGTAVAYFFLFVATYKSKIIYMNGTIIRPLYVISDFPFDTYQSPIYEIIVFCQSIGVILSCIAFSTYDCFYVSSILHFSGQLYNLKHRFKNLVLEHQRKNMSFARCLRSVTRRHLHLVSCADSIEEIFNKTFLLQVFATSVAMCLQGYQCVTIIADINAASKAILIFIIVFTVTNLSSIFMYSFIAQILRDESQALFYAAYQMNWYEMPAKDAVLVVLLMNRCLRPIEITVGKFAPFTLEYFTKVVKTSVGYLSVLLAVKDKIVET